ncbi:MAG: flagellar motor switch protein FliN [Rhizobacter sp.]|jgi:flagellar motor switch protein FliN/FliY|nr:flagellar motor switch protein FliN [Rhizobacter sp.]
MDMTDITAIDNLLADLPEEAEAAAPLAAVPEAPKEVRRRDIPRLMRKIPVTITLEVGAARISLSELMDIKADSVIELDSLAGEPLILKVNGTQVGTAEVVVSGDKYGLKVVDVAGLDLDSLTA